MSREQAAIIVGSITFRAGQFAAVSREAASLVLGNAAFEALTRDKIRGIGPTQGTIYPWNVVDYLCAAK